MSLAIRFYAIIPTLACPALFFFFLWGCVMQYKELVRLLQSRNLRVVANNVNVNYRYLLRIAKGEVDNPPVLLVEELAHWITNN